MNTIDQKTLGSSSDNENSNADELFDRRKELVMGSVDLYHGYLIKYLKSFAPHDCVEDVVQELWKYVLLKFPLEKIQDVGLLRKKAYQLFIDQYRKSKVLSEAKTMIMLEPTRENGEAVFSASSEAKLQERFWLEYDVGLTDLQKEVVWHHARYGMTFEEIEQALGIKASTACDWMKLARKKIAAVIND